jgi:hypothetical protein
MLLGAFAFLVLTLTLARPPHGGSHAATPDGARTVEARADATSASGGGEISAGDAAANEGAAQNTSSERAEAGALNGGRFKMPVLAWSKPTDRFGAPRGGGLVHAGIDLALEGLSHSHVFSACTGSVSSTGYSGAYGNHVIVDCGDGFTTLYGHLSQVLVTKTQAVDNSVVLGISGSTGYSTGEHLHFEIRLNDLPVNPENYLDFHIAPGTPLSDGPIVFPKSATPTPEPATNEPAPTSTPTATPVPPTRTPTPTPTATPTPRTPKKTATPPPIAQN